MLICEQGVLLHTLVDALAYAADDLFVLGCIEHFFYQGGYLYHEVFLGTASGDSGRTEAYSAGLEG